MGGERIRPESARPESFFGSKLTIHNEHGIDTTQDETAERRRMTSGEDFEALERAEQQIDAFIEKRAREAKDAAAIDEAWRESERRHRERRRLGVHHLEKTSSPPSVEEPNTRGGAWTLYRGRKQRRRSWTPL